MLYQLPLCGGIAGNFPISRMEEVLGFDCFILGCLKTRGQPPWAVLWMVCLLSLGGEVVDHVPVLNPVCNVPLWPGLGWRETP